MNGILLETKMTKYVLFYICFITLLKANDFPFELKDYPSLKDDYHTVSRSINQAKSQKHNKHLIMLLDYPIENSVGNTPIAYSAQNRLFKRFRAAGFPHCPNYGVVKLDKYQNHIDNAKKWWELNEHKIRYNEDGSHYFEEPPIGVQTYTGELIPYEEIRVKLSIPDRISPVIVKPKSILKVNKTSTAPSIDNKRNPTNLITWIAIVLLIIFGAAIFVKWRKNYI